MRAYFLGCIACPKIETRPLQACEALWGGEMPEFESMDDVNELMQALMNGLWNRLIRHQSRKHPFRLTPLRAPTNKAKVQQFAQTRVEELEAFVNGLFGDNEALELPESAHEALTNVTESRSLFVGFDQFADDYVTNTGLAETVRKMQQLSIIAAKEVNAVVLGCTRARRAALETMEVTPPVWH
ncbi:MAG: hypothetical protein ACE5KS_01930 [Woeseiaceae bacterium]